MLVRERGGSYPGHSNVSFVGLDPRGYVGVVVHTFTIQVELLRVE